MEYLDYFDLLRFIGNCHLYTKDELVSIARRHRLRVSGTKADVCLEVKDFIKSPRGQRALKNQEIEYEKMFNRMQDEKHGNKRQPAGDAPLVEQAAQRSKYTPLFEQSTFQPTSQPIFLPTFSSQPQRPASPLRLFGQTTQQTSQLVGQPTFPPTSFEQIPKTTQYSHPIYGEPVSFDIFGKQVYQAPEFKPSPPLVQQPAFQPQRPVSPPRSFRQSIYQTPQRPASPPTESLPPSRWPSPRPPRSPVYTYFGEDGYMSRPRFR